MLVKDVDVDIIKKLLDSVPSGVEIESIQLTNGYQLRLIAGTEEINKEKYSKSLKELNDLISSLSLKLLDGQNYV